MANKDFVHVINIGHVIMNSFKYFFKIMLPE